jgi:type III secretory pathway component EscR
MTLNPIKAFNEWQYKRWEPWREYHNKKAEEYENLWFKDAEFDNLGIEHTKEIVQSILWGAKISLSIFEN